MRNKETAVRRIDEVASTIVQAIRPCIEPAPAKEPTDFFPSYDTTWMRRLREAGFDAHRRGATISVIRRGILVQAEGKSELVPFDLIEGGLLMKALNRVAPTPEEIYDMTDGVR